MRGRVYLGFPGVGGTLSAEPPSTFVSSRSSPRWRLFMTLAWKTWRRISPGADSPFSRGRARGKESLLTLR